MTNTTEPRTDFPGAKWWKFDFHTHTPASDDFLQGCNKADKSQVTPKHWLKRFMEKGIDCVAVTDHNGGAWIDRLKNTLADIRREPPDWYREIHLFPGVEISVQGGVHILAVFGPGKKTGDIDGLLGAVSYKGEKGRSDGVTEKSVTEVIDEIVSSGGIAIPAHADKEKGLFKACKGATLETVLGSKNIYAMELCDQNFQLPALYSEKKISWTEVIGSDLHNFRSENFGSDFTWIKMDDPPGLAGLRLALIDGQTSVRRNTGQNPNKHADFVIESLTVSEAKYIGKSQRLECRFSPFLTTIIGSRGSGKSTLLEFMRRLFRREGEIPGALKQESRKYFEIGGDNLLTGTSKLALVYLKGDSRYRLNWSAQAEEPSLEKQGEDARWQPEAGEINSLFPVRVYSQKQIFELAKQPQALLDIIDEAPEIQSDTLAEERQRLIGSYKSRVMELSELENKIASENKIKGELNEYERLIQQIEKSGHREVLQAYRRRRQQLLLIERIERAWKDMADSLKELLGSEPGGQDGIAPVQIAEGAFSMDEGLDAAIGKSNQQWSTIRKKLQGLVQEAQKILDNWQQEKQRSGWMKLIQTDMSRYEQLKNELEQQGIDPGQYPRLLQQRELARQKLREIEQCRKQQAQLEKEQDELIEQAQSTREQLTYRRKKFLGDVLGSSNAVNIKVIDYGQEWDDIETALRKKLGCESHFGRDMESLEDLYTTKETGKKGIQALKQRILGIRYGRKRAEDTRFVKHLQTLNNETMADLRLWFPKDNLEITFGRENRSIQEGSPGQKTAALLAFILSYGNEPLLLDQPEDDLDNELIYDLIVKQIRAIKPQRQVIVITHNANIVVNGDAEMVLPLAVSGGQTQIEAPGSIQQKHVRERICAILEGGKEAFEQRYKRIKLERD